MDPSLCAVQGRILRASGWLEGAAGPAGGKMVTVFTEDEFPSWARSDLMLGSLLRDSGVKSLLALGIQGGDFPCP